MLVNNAALNPKMKKTNNNKITGNIEKYSLDYLKKEIDVNLIVAFAMIKHFGTLMSKEKMDQLLILALIYQ